MIKDKCSFPSCEIELDHIKGRKKKKYCCVNHNVRHWQMLNAKKVAKTKNIPIEKWNEIQKEMELARKKLKDMIDNPMGIHGTKGVFIDLDKLDESKPTEKKVPLQVKENDPTTTQRIKELEYELKNPPKTALIGLANWKRIRENELAQLKNTK